MNAQPLASLPGDSLPANEAVFRFEAPQPLFLWLSACTDTQCNCRTALAVLTGEGAEAARRQGAIAREARDEGSMEIAARLGSATHFFLNMDTGAAYWHTSDDWMDVSTEPRIKAVLPFLDGELLDHVARLWCRGRGQEEHPEAALLHKKQLVVANWTPGDLVGWDDLNLHLRMDVYELGKKTYRCFESYCPTPGCTCKEFNVGFWVLRRKHWVPIGSVTVPVPGVPRLLPREGHSSVLHELWSAYEARYPGYPSRYAQRDALMKQIGARFANMPAVARRPASPPPTPALSKPVVPLPRLNQVGRNEPCPCGSGLKYKKCCGK